MVAQENLDGAFAQVANAVVTGIVTVATYSSTPHNHGTQSFSSSRLLPE